MASQHEDALAEFLHAFDERLATAPVVDRRVTDRRDRRQPKLIDAARASGPVRGDFAYWASA